MMEQQDSMTQQSEQTEKEQQPSNKIKNEVIEWAKAIAIAVILVVFIRWLVFAPFMVDGPSMQPNFVTAERLIVNKFIYDFRKPKPGEVIVFHVPQEKRDYIKRVIALPGDTVKVEGDEVFVNGQKVNETYIQEAIDAKHENGELYNTLKDFPNAEFPDGKVPEGHVFVMGDNRSNSTDSRSIGYIDMKEIVGRADLVFWPLNELKFVKH